MIIIIWGLSFFFGEEAIRGEVSRQIQSFMGHDAAKSIEDMIAGALIDKENFFMKTIGVLTLIFGATTIFFQLQKSLNELWDVQAAPKQAFVKLLLDRANSLGMILIIAFLLLISMVLSSIIGWLNGYITYYFGLETFELVRIINMILSFSVIVILFALMFKVLPDVEISWKSVWAGALLTALLFTLGKFLLSLYFENFKPTSAFGAAGTIILIMMWVNYTCMLVFFGAEFTKVYTYKKGFKIEPSKHAKWSNSKLYKEIQKEQI